MSFFDLRLRNDYNKYTSRFEIPRNPKKPYEVYLFFYDNDNFILKELDPDIWDTVHGHPNNNESDLDALFRFADKQFNISINIDRLKFISKDIQDNRFYFYNENVHGKRINYLNYSKYEDLIDFFIYVNLTTLFCDLLTLSRSKQIKRRERLHKLGLITLDNIFCKRCDSFHCICNSRRKQNRTSSSVDRHRVRY
jgi:hypothetical protein